MSDRATAPFGKWLRFLAWEVPLLVVSCSAFLYWRSAPAPDPEIRQKPLALQVIARAGQLQIEWNPAAEVMNNAGEGLIEIVDGVESQSIALTRAMLAERRYSYVPTTDDVLVRMTIRELSGDRTEGSVRFLGSLTEIAPAREGPPDVEPEIRRLREINRQQAARIENLQTSVRQLEKQLGISQ